MTQRTQSDDSDYSVTRLTEQVHVLRAKVAQLEQEMADHAGKVEAYRPLVEDAPHGVAVVQDARIVLVSEGLANITGYNADELKGMSPDDITTLVHPDDRETVEEFYLKQLEGEDQEGIVRFRIRSRNGDVRWIEGRSAAAGYGGRPAMHWVLADITRHWDRNEILRQSEEQFRLFYECSPLGYQSLDTDGRIKQVNPAWLEMLGYAPEDVVGRWFGDFLAPGMRQVFADRFAVFKRRGTVTAAKWEMVREDGRMIAVELDGRADYDADGVFSQSHCVLRDTTERERAIRALENSEQVYRTLVNGLPDIVMRFDRDGRHLFVSDNVVAVTGIGANQFIGKTHRELGFPEDKCRLWEDAIRAVFETGQPCESEFSYEAANGPIIFNWRLLPERNGQGQTVSVLTISRDVTAHRQVERALHESEKRYRLLFDQMLSGMALHEVITNESGTPVDYRFLSVNTAFEHMTGLKASDIVGRTVREVLPENESVWIERYGRVALTGEPAQFEEFSEPLGRYYEVRAYSPKPRQFAVVFNDITERTQAEEALRQSTARLRSLYESVQAGIIVQKADGRIVHCNPMAAEVFGMTAEDIQSRTSTDSVWQMMLEDGTPLAGEDHPSMVTIRTGQPIRGAVRGLFSESRDRTRWLLINTEPQFEAESGELEEVIITFLDITDLRQAAESLRENEEKFRALFEQAPDSVVLIDAQTGTIVEFNDRAHEALGYTRQEFRYMNLSDVEAAESADEVIDHRAVAMQTGQDVFETRHRTKDGRLLDVLVSVRVVSLRERKFFLSIWIDITRRKRAERALRESEDKYRSLFSEMSSGCALHEVIHDPDGTPCDYITLEVNKTYEMLLNAPRETVVGKRASEILPPQELRRWMGVFGAVAKTGVSRHYQMYSEVNAKWFEGTAFSPQPGRFGVTFNDITARKEAERSLELQRAELQAIYDHTPVMMCVLDSERRVLYANRALQEFTGLSEEALTAGRACGIFGCINALDDARGCGYGPKCSECQLLRAMEETLRTGRRCDHIEYRATLRRGEHVRHIVLMGATAMVVTRDGSNLLLCLQDVTKQRAATDRAKQREAELAHVSRLTTLGEMASGLAHELNQPLSAVLNYSAACSKLAAAKSPDLRRISTNLDRIIAQADRATQIMSRIRAFAQRRPPRLGPVNLAHAATRVVDLLSWDIRQKDIDVKLELSDAPAPVRADAVQIDQVLLNLAKNAIEAMQEVPRGQRQLTIRTHASPEGTVRVEVSGTGVGLPAEDTDRIFEAFFSTKPDGIGIGLSISRTIVEMHHGTLEAHNNPGAGCTFVMVLPLEEAAERRLG